MSKNKDIVNIEEIEEPSVFPEGHIMNEWDSRDFTRESELSIERGTQSSLSLDKDDSEFHIPKEWWPEGYQLGWCIEYLLGQPQPDNLRKRQRQGWEFVHDREIPQMKIVLMDHEFDRNRTDGFIRIGGQILMKKPQDVYDKEQHMRMVKDQEIKRQSQSLTDYLGGGKDPRFVVENTGKYEVNHRMRRG